jgi:hypothetical protein
MLHLSPATSLNTLEKRAGQNLMINFSCHHRFRAATVPQNRTTAGSSCGGGARQAGIVAFITLSQSAPSQMTWRKAIPEQTETKLATELFRQGNPRTNSQKSLQQRP